MCLRFANLFEAGRPQRVEVERRTTRIFRVQVRTRPICDGADAAFGGHFHKLFCGIRITLRNQPNNFTW